MPIDPRWGFTEEQIARDVRKELERAPVDIKMTDAELALTPVKLALGEAGATAKRHEYCTSLPLELLSHILEKLDPSSVVKARQVCRKFKQAAWPSFARTFDQRVFHPTTQGIRNLAELASIKSAGPYLKTLNFSTVVPDFNSRNNIDGRTRSYRNAKYLAPFLREVLLRLPHLVEICVVDGPKLPRYKSSGIDHKYDRLRSEEGPPMVRVGAEKYVDLAAHDHTFELIFHAYSNERSRLPQVRKLTSIGHIAVTGLPSVDHQLPSITHLDLSVTDALVVNKDRREHQQFCIPNLLNSLQNLETLSLRFLDDKNAGFYVEPTPLFKETGFKFMAWGTQLYRLRNLYLAHLVLSHGHAQGLQEFLYGSRKTLRKVGFMSLALSVVEWRPFITFIARSMSLDFFALDSDLSVEAAMINKAWWSRMPRDLLPTEADFQGAAKSSCTVNGKNVEKKPFGNFEGLIGS